MAALTGVMTADFTQFTTEIDRSVVKLQEFERAGKGTATGLYDLEGGLRQVDATLGTMGIRIGPQIRALEEMRALAGKSIADIGVGGLAGAITAVGVASITATRAVVDFIKPWYDVDKAVGQAIASMLGWGDVALANAGAQTELFARATALAGREIRNVDEAIKIVKASNDAMSASWNTGAYRLSQWSGEISKLRDSGALQEIDRELKAGTSTQKQLAAQYGISEAALAFYVNRAKESTAIFDKMHAAEEANLKKVAAAQEELNQAGGGWRTTLETIAPAVAASATAYLALGESQSTIATAMGLSTGQVSALNKALQEQTRILQLNEPALGSLDGWMKSLAPEIRKAGESQMFFDQQLMASIATVEEAAVPALEKLETTFRSVTEAAREAAAPSKNAPGSVGVDLGGVAFGNIDVNAAMKAYTARFQGGSLGAIGGGPAPDFLSWAMKMGYASKGGTAINNNFNIVDTESEIARRVSEEISKQIQRGSLVQ